jgi:hypothetical protein
MPKEKDLALNEELKIVEDLLDHPDTESQKALLDKYKLTTARLNGILRSNSTLVQEMFANRCQMQVLKENRFISEIKEKGFAYFLDSITLATLSENPLAYLDKITKMIDSVDKIDRLNRNQSTENITTKSETTTTSVNVSDLLKQLENPEDKKNFLLKKMEDLKFNKDK